MPPLAITLTTKMHLGPAMTVLNDRQRAFVIALNNAGGKNATEAARAAGYIDSGSGGIKVQAHHMLHDPRIQAAILEDARARFVGDLHETLDRIEGIAKNTQHPKQLDALKIKLHHAGMVEVKRTEIDVTGTVTFEQKIDRLTQLARATGKDPEEVLRRLGLQPVPEVTDAEFEDVTDEIDSGGLW